jgi:DNA-binding CsgD family transcriptional regulator
MRLSTRDLSLLQEAVLEMHEPRDLSQVRRAAPEIFKRAIPADYFVWRESGSSRFGFPDDDAVLWESPERTDPKDLREMYALRREHPFTLHALRTGDLGPHRLSDFWTKKQQLASPIQRHVYDRLGVWWYLAVALVRGDRVGTLGLGRPAGNRDFSRRDVVMLRLLAPHFAQALSAATLLTARREDEAGVMTRLGLSRREAQVAGWLARGRTNSEIARILALKPRTVEKHVAHILDKLGVENRTAAAGVILQAIAARPEPVAASGPAHENRALRRALLPPTGRARRSRSGTAPA